MNDVLIVIFYMKLRLVATSANIIVKTFFFLKIK